MKKKHGVLESVKIGGKRMKLETPIEYTMHHDENGSWTVESEDWLIADCDSKELALAMFRECVRGCVLDGDIAVK